MTLLKKLYIVLWFAYTGGQDTTKENEKESWTDKKATRRTNQLEGMPTVMDLFRVCLCKSMPVTAELHTSFATRDQKSV